MPGVFGWVVAERIRDSHCHFVETNRDAFENQSYEFLFHLTLLVTLLIHFHNFQMKLNLFQVEFLMIYLNFLLNVD